MLRHTDEHALLHLVFWVLLLYEPCRLCVNERVDGVAGHQLLAALNNSVSMYPKLEGRFPQVSGVTFAFDAEQAPGERVDPRFVKVQGEYPELERVS